MKYDFRPLFVIDKSLNAWKIWKLYFFSKKNFLIFRTVCNFWLSAFGKKLEFSFPVFLSFFFFSSSTCQNSMTRKFDWFLLILKAYSTIKFWNKLRWGLAKWNCTLKNIPFSEMKKKAQLESWISFSSVDYL